jgi:hypothetical protein
VASAVPAEHGVMFRRAAFRQEGFDKTPMWHVFDHFGDWIDRDGVNHGPSRLHYVALCGYEYTFSLEEPLRRREVKDMSKRCRKCDRALSEITGEPMPRPRKTRKKPVAAAVSVAVDTLPKPDTAEHIPYRGSNPEADAIWCAEHDEYEVF